MQKPRSAAEKADLVEEYMALRHGLKLSWLKVQAIPYSTMGKWRAAYLFGDLERGLVPRDTTGMSLESTRVKQLQKRLAQEQAERQAEQERHRAEITRLEQVNETLGKAIGLLHDRAAKQEPTDAD